MSILKTMRAAISYRYRLRGRFNGSLDRLNRLPRLQEFIKKSPVVPIFHTRESLWTHLACRLEGAVDYLEFGVHRGDSILHWTKTNTNVESRFVGFDTFEGLPEEWNRSYPRGHFDMKGVAPNVPDARVTFVKGLFQTTLDGFLSNYIKRNKHLVVHIDCDLYSSTLYCLTRLDKFLSPGSIIIFDEFGDVQHEFRAFEDYTASYRREARLIAAHDDFFTVAVEIVS